MNLREKLDIIHNVGRWTMLMDDEGEFCLFSTRDEDGNLRDSGWWKTKKEAIECQRGFCGYLPEDFDYYAKEENWRIVRTGTPEEFDNVEGYKEEDKVRIVGKDSVRFIKGKSGGDWRIWNKDRTNWIFLPPSAIEPYFEDEEEEEMVEVKISKSTLKTALEELKKRGIRVIIK